jgi:hypothetical protein
MVDKVIILGVRRANELLPIKDVKQSIGRAGRSYSKTGEATIIVPETDELYALKCIDGETPPIMSEMDNINQIAFHILPFWGAVVYDEDSFNKWYSKTLAFVQNKKVNWNEVYSYLIQTGCIQENEVTPFGKISILTYFSPDRLCSIRERMKEIYADGNINDKASFSWMLAECHIPVSNANALELSEYKSDVKSKGYFFTKGELVHGFVYFCLLNNKRPKWIKHLISGEMDDIRRLFSACSMIAEIEGFPIQKQLEETETCIIKKVPIEIANIMNEFGIELKRYAYELADLNIFTKEELERNEDYVVSYGTDDLKNYLTKKGYMEHSKVQNWRKELNG